MASMGANAQQALAAVQPIGVALAGVGATGAFAINSVVSEAKSFNSQAALMKVAAGNASVGFDALHDAAIRVGGDTRLVGVSASGAAQSITDLYKAGLDTTQIFGDLNEYMDEGAELGGVLRASIDLAAASELDMAQGADVLSVAMATFGRKADEASDIGNNFVQAADASVASVNELAAAMRNVGPTAASFGWELEDVNTALAILSQRGIKGSEAGTALKSMMTNIMRPTDQVKEALHALNVELYDNAGRMLSLPDILSQFQGALSGVTEEQKNQYVQTLAGTYGMKAMNTLLAEGTAGWNNMENAIAGASSAQEVGAAKADTYAGKLEAFEGSIESAKISLGEEFLPKLTEVVEEGTGLVESFNALDPAAKSATASIAGIGTAIAGAGGGFLLLAPRILKTVEALQALSGMTGVTSLFGNISTGASLVAEGATVAEASSLGFGSALGAVAVPAATVAAGLGAVYAIATKLPWNVSEQEARDYGRELAEASAIIEGTTASQETLNTAMDSFSEGQRVLTERATEAANALTAGQMGDYAEMAAHAAEATSRQAQSLRLTAQAQAQMTGVKGFEARAQSLNAMADAYARVAFEAAVSQSSFASTAAAMDAAAASASNLATSASTIAGSFGNLEFTNQTLWNMAMASGANVEQLGQLAQKLGIASEAEVQNTIATYALMESYGAGAITTEQLTAQFNNLSIAQKVAVSDTNLLAGAELEAEANARALADSIGASDAQFRQAASGAKEVASAVEAIPSHKKVTIEINTVEAARQVRSSVSGGHLQHGTTHWGGGLATVGETGPELVSLPRGSRVWNSQQSQRMSSGPTWNGNIVVQGASDPQAAAQAVLRALQDRGMLPRTALR